MSPLDSNSFRSTVSELIGTTCAAQASLILISQFDGEQLYSMHPLHSEELHSHLRAAASAAIKRRETIISECPFGRIESSSAGCADGKIMVSIAILTTEKDLSERDDQSDRKLQKIAQLVASALNLNQERMELLERVQVLSSIGSLLVHELRSPLTTISSRLAIIERMVASNPLDERGILAQATLIHQAIQAAGDIATGLGAMESQHEADGHRVVSALSMIQKALSLLGRRATENGVNIQMGLISSSIAVRCHPSQIIQVLLNLLNNAIEALVVSEEKTIRIHCMESTDQIQFRISDTGPGIPADLHEKVFEHRFSTKKDRGGNGLGLGVCRRIVAAHFGNLYIDPSRSSGCTLILELPKVSPEQA